MAQQGQGETGKHSPTKVTQCLGGIDFPAGKDDLVRHAQSHDADQEVMDVLKQMPAREYGSMADVMKGVGQVE